MQVQETDAQIDELDSNVLGQLGLQIARGPGHQWRRGQALAAQAGKIQPFGHHVERTIGVARPLRPRPVPIELESIAVGVAEIQGLADPVIGRTLEGNGGLVEPAQGVRQRGAVGVPDREVVEPGCALRWRGGTATLPRVEADVVMVAAGAQKRRRVAHPLRDLESQHAVVEREGPLEVGNLQVHVADVHARIDGILHVRGCGRPWPWSRSGRHAAASARRRGTGGR